MTPISPLMFHVDGSPLILEQKGLFSVFSLACLNGHGQRAYAAGQDLQICQDNMGI